MCRNAICRFTMHKRNNCPPKKLILKNQEKLVYNQIFSYPQAQVGIVMGLPTCDGLWVWGAGVGLHFRTPRKPAASGMGLWVGNRSPMHIIYLKFILILAIKNLTGLETHQNVSQAHLGWSCFVYTAFQVFHRIQSIYTIKY